MNFSRNFINTKYALMKTTPISAIMTKNVVCVTPDQEILDVKHIYEKKAFHHHIPVTINEKLVGMVSLIDFMYRIKGAGLDDKNEVYTNLTVKDIMTPNPKFMESNATVKQAAEILSEGNFRALPIVENQKVVGIVSTADIIRFYLDKHN